MADKKQISYKFTEDKSNPSKRVLNIWTPKGHWFVVCSYCRWFPKDADSESQEDE